jgi:putative membrane protein
MMPAMIVSLALGTTMLVLQPELLRMPWMHMKLGAIVFLLGYHGFASHTRKRFLAKDYFLSETACRWINEVPTILLFFIVIGVIVRKPM